MSSLDQRLSTIKQDECPHERSPQFLAAYEAYRNSAQRSEHILTFITATHECFNKACGLPCLGISNHIHAMTNKIVPFPQDIKRTA